MSTDIQSAIEKARQIAAKLAKAPNAPQETLKRPAETHGKFSQIYLFYQCIKQNYLKILFFFVL